MENNNTVNPQTLPNNQNGKTNANPEKVSVKKVAIIYFGGLLAAIIITWGIGGFDEELLYFAWCFPWGCLILTPVEDKYLNFSYLVYVVVFILAFTLRQKKIFINLLIIYFLILCLNIVGCSMMQNIHIS